MTAVPESSVFPRDGSVGVDAVALRTGHRHAGRVRPRRADSLTRRRRDVGGNLRKRRIAIGSRPPGRGCGVRCGPGWPAPRASAVCGSAAARVGGRSGGWVPTIVPAQSSPPWGGCSFGGLGEGSRAATRPSAGAARRLVVSRQAAVSRREGPLVPWEEDRSALWAPGGGGYF